MSSPNQNIRVRIAPSPTGPLHIGTARTALFNWLFAKKEGATFVLRIEDTDLERSDRAYEQDIIENLKWLGITWEEGIDVGGPHAPYRQSERIATYTPHMEKLLEERKAFYCYHSEKELKKDKEEQFAKKEAPRHSCSHFNNPPKETAEKGIIRFRTPIKEVSFHDIIRGTITFNTELLGDISIARNPSTPLYNFAVVVDDFEMKISHVIRGEDHISNTPKQVLIQEALGFSQPVYAHLPLILGPDRSKLSKRHGALSISWYREQGYLAGAILNFIALLGWNPGGEEEFFSKDTLISEFSLERVQKAGAVFDIHKLDWLNGNYIRSLDIEELTEKCIPFLGELVQPKEEKYQIKETGEIIDFEYLKKVVALYQERMKKLSEIGELADFFFKDELRYPKELLRWKNMTDSEVAISLDTLTRVISQINNHFTKEIISETLMAEAEKVGDPSTGSGQDKGRLFWPLRVALSGKEASPDPIDIALVLGKEKALERIRQAGLSV